MHMPWRGHHEFLQHSDFDNLSVIIIVISVMEYDCSVAYDKLAARLVTALSKPPVQGNHLPNSFIEYFQRT